MQAPASSYASVPHCTIRDDILVFVTKTAGVTLISPDVDDTRGQDFHGSQRSDEYGSFSYCQSLTDSPNRANKLSIDQRTSCNIRPLDCKSWNPYEHCFTFLYIVIIISFYFPKNDDIWVNSSFSFYRLQAIVLFAPHFLISESSPSSYSYFICFSGVVIYSPVFVTEFRFTISTPFWCIDMLSYIQVAI